MSDDTPTVVGIDVGGERKGFHAVALRGGRFDKVRADADPVRIVEWCRELGSCVVAVDAPCAWSVGGSSRLAERELRIGGRTIQCFRTPTRTIAAANTKAFYGWVFNGERLYTELGRDYRMFDGQPTDSATVLETFPQAVACVLARKAVPAKPKVTVRRGILRASGYALEGLRNIDFVDAALCAVAAEAFRQARWTAFGDVTEGFIVVPRPTTT